ncbi:hypothetical protein GCM10009680_41540 [Streptomyces yatensis]|uniref:Uncharacterized protein n=1 Tax=Streptomyces yatensis TaxID=155177 RepID=A0ABN2I1T7_9ACTN
MLGERAAAKMVSDLIAQVRAHGKDGACVAVSQCGAHPDAVTIEKSHTTAHGTSLTWTFPAHSVTLLRFSPEKAGATSSNKKRTSHA